MSLKSSTGSQTRKAGSWAKHWNGRSRLWRTRLERVRSPRELRRRQNTTNKPAHRRRGGQGGAAGTLGVARLLWLVRCGGGERFQNDKIFTQSLTQFHISRI